MSSSQAATWERFDAMEVRLSAPLSERMLDLAVRAGDRILDLASGRGEPAVRAARRVGEAGYVLATDRSDAILGLARRRARVEGVTNLGFAAVDAGTLGCVRSGWADAVLCRWGLMYFDAPVAALHAARRILRPGGCLALAVWAELERVSYLAVPRSVLAAYVPVDPVDPARPGPTRYGAPERLATDLRTAGFDVVHEEELEVPVLEARTDDELVEWVLAFGSGAVRGLPEERQRAWRADLVAAAEPHRAGGVVRLGGVTRLVVARTPPAP